MSNIYVEFYHFDALIRRIKVNNTWYIAGNQYEFDSCIFELYCVIAMADGTVIIQLKTEDRPRRFYDICDIAEVK